MQKKILVVVGARPQFIKAAVVSRALRRHGRCREILLHTGQHYDNGMSDIFFKELEIAEPAYYLGVGSGHHGVQTAHMLIGIEEVLLKERPDCVVVYGDTNSTLAGALAASKLHVPLTHVEAGLRSFNRNMPEEINRIVSDHLADILFAPTATAVKNLHREGIQKKRIHQIGDVMYDAALYYAEKALQQSHILNQLGLKKGHYVLATIHRAENVDVPDRLEVILMGLSRASTTLPVVLPLHPRTQKRLSPRSYSILENSKIRIIEPVGYLDMIMLEKSAKAIATDSGGVQKEAFFYGVPCVTLRDETEWVELVELGWNTVVPPFDPERICNAVINAMPGTAVEPFPYGDGHSADRIAEVLVN